MLFLFLPLNYEIIGYLRQPISLAAIRMNSTLRGSIVLRVRSDEFAVEFFCMVFNLKISKVRKQPEQQVGSDDENFSLESFIESNFKEAFQSTASELLTTGFDNSMTAFDFDGNVG